jgi:hypothetical protein
VDRHSQCREDGSQHAAALHGVEVCVEPCLCIPGAFDRDVARRQRRAREAAERRTAPLSAQVPLTPVCHTRVTTFAPSNANSDPPNHLRLTPGGAPMPTVKLRATTILGELEQAQTELVGKAVILTDGKAGTVESVLLDEMHGLRISIRGHDGKWPICTIKFMQPD